MKIVKTTRPLLVCLLAVAAATITAGQASAATLTVCPSGCAFSQIAPALAAANNGDTISIAPGTYKGGVTIEVSVTIAGAGPGRTIISGGGPVLTIGTFDAASEPTVSIGGVTITGGVTHSSFAEVFAGPGVIALGGGISVPPAAGFAPGATVTIANSVITGNKVAPTTAIDSGLPCPPDITITCINGDLPFAQAAGGGINTFGALTLTNTTVSNNQAGAPVASDVGPGGIASIEGGLRLKNSTVMGNQAIASAPNGRFAETGGVAVFGGTLTVDNTRISDNTASLSSSMPSDIPGGTGAFAGGINVGAVSGATITDTTISGNAATMTNSVGDAFASSGGGEISGTLTNVRLTGNSVDVSSAAGNATALGGASVFDGGTITNSLVSNNHIHAAAPLGSVDVSGGGMNLFGPTTLRNSTVSGNTVDASGASGSARGGGIFDIAFPEGPDGPPGGPLTLRNSNVTANTLSGTAAVTFEGGGVYLQDEPITLTNSVITQNVPDQCFGC